VHTANDFKHWSGPSVLPIIPANKILHIITSPIIFVHQSLRDYGPYIRYVMKYGFMLFWVIYIIAAISVSNSKAVPVLILTLFFYGYLFYVSCVQALGYYSGLNKLTPRQFLGNELPLRCFSHFGHGKNHEMPKWLR